MIIPASVFPPAHWVKRLMNGAMVGTGDHYVKQTIRNRYTILASHGPLMLTVPVEGQKGQKVPLSDIRIFGDSWRSQHWHSIRSAYGKSAFFIHLADPLEQLFAGHYPYLTDFQLAAWAIIQSVTSLPSWNMTVNASGEAREYDLEWEPSFRPESAATYPQVFSDRMHFVPGLSVLDLAMNLGPGTAEYLERM